MKRFEIYDPAMCCSTGVCGPEIDPLLVRFAADMKWVQDQGVEVRRFNLSQNPAAFVENELVKRVLTEEGEAALPMILAENKILCTGRYPERDELGMWAGLAAEKFSIYSPAVNELVAIGAAIASNCEPCLKYHFGEARKLGVSRGDMARAVEMAAKVKDAPHQGILRLAHQLTGSSFRVEVTEPDNCCGAPEAGAESAGAVCCRPTSGGRGK
ncbi:MAG: arsenite efflux transporter metallochaperone ArsD [Verrucomicrobia bacterium]|nr:arsenite efflux transporter metallochaperone ArsD [Verrucomicrobiota bacterium]